MFLVLTMAIFMLTVRLIRYTKQLDFIDGEKKEIACKSSFFFIYETHNFFLVYFIKSFIKLIQINEFMDMK